MSIRIRRVFSIMYREARAKGTAFAHMCGSPPAIKAASYCFFFFLHLTLVIRQQKNIYNITVKEVVRLHCILIPTEGTFALRV